MKQETFNKLSWASVVLSLSLVIFAWGADVNWRVGSLNAYQWFPLFGLVAWIIMAGHYYLGALRIENPGIKKPAHYAKVTEYIVLASLLLHPTILAIKQKQVGEGTPPNSFVNYVGENMKLAVILGSFSLFLFLSFEVLTRLKSNKTVQKYWLAVSVSQSLAMILIWVHGLRLGGVLEQNWFRFIWILLGLMLLPCIYLIHKTEFSDKK